MNEFSNMQLFVNVVQEGSFSATARTLGVTPSSVSRQISQLENALGTRLFQRTTRKQSLTEAGRIYFQHAERIIADLETAQLAVKKLTDSPSGSLHITAEADFAQCHIAPILPSFLDAYPDINVRLSMSGSMIDLVEGEIDMAIRMGHLEDSSLIARKIATSRSIICATNEYLQKYGTPTHPTELSSHNCLSFKVKAGRNQWRFKSPDEQTKDTIKVTVSGRINVNSLVFLKNMALKNQGIVMIPSWIITKELKDKKLIPVLEDFLLDPASTPIHGVFAHNRHLAPKVRAFVDYLSQSLTSLD